ncbi:hypothetical protein L593_13370 [Salinarchaeum sp. Harcht-Bsk1]|uniref:DUF7504 family protein n=1 Tax=Salinarchaeum sp. Harcht-Bsk1 TaxID=1333523 RepID=UPI0003424465|nr:hypothetical protein [Salinarchaeum sp. Harcht-Bsk1]AGN02613.1 hypothetical protein L593_13370 [Salinarchaeum sp. Harcht-Bsk1]
MDEKPPQQITHRPGTCELLLAPGRTAGTAALGDRLTDPDTSTAVLYVTTGNADDAVDRLRTRSVPAEAIGVVDASGADRTPDGVAESAVVGGPGSLSALGIAVSDVLERLSHRFDRVVIGFDSTTDVLDAAPLPATFRFFHVLCGRVRTGEAVLLATIDSTAHDEETRRTIAELFDLATTIE